MYSKLGHYKAYLLIYPVKFTIEKAMKAQTGSKFIAVIFCQAGTKWRWVANTTPRPLYPREGNPVLIVQEAGWTTETVCTGTENLFPT
jgi:hypothetical protein